MPLRWAPAILLVGIAFLLTFRGTSAPASIVFPLVVDLTTDENVPNCGFNVPGDCSLRGAINQANSLDGPNTITFDLGEGTPTINVGSITGDELPVITESLTINGDTGGADRIELNGSMAVDDGISILASDVTIDSLVINRFPDAGISMDSSQISNIVVTNSYIGTDSAGSAATGYGNGGSGILNDAVDDMRIGGSSPGEGNVISGNGIFGILAISALRSSVIGNYIGTDSSGTIALPNGEEGIRFSNITDGTIGGSAGTTPGGPCTGACNLVSGNGGHGIELTTASSDNVVAGNYVGTGFAGLTAIPNGSVGLVVTGDNNTIGGLSPESRNLVSGNTNNGMTIFGDGNEVLGNLVGTNRSGDAGVGNGTSGIYTSFGPNCIGGAFIGQDCTALPGSGNLISGNNSNGLFIPFSNGTIATVVLNNLVGTDLSGETPIPNLGDGVYVGTKGVIIGRPGAGNNVAFNAQRGIRVDINRCPSTISGNSIYSNGGDGIDTNCLAPPVVTGAGSASGTACPNCTVEVFSDDEDEGRVYHGSTVADGNGDWSFAGDVVGPNITATATDGDGNTSEFSEPFVLFEPTPTPSPTPNQTPPPTPTPTGQTPTPTPTPTPTGQTPTVTPTPTATAAPSPPPGGLTQGDNDCDGDVDAVDALQDLRHVAALPVDQHPDCTDIGAAVPAGGEPQIFGDVDCDGDVDAVDALQILRFVAGLAVNQADGCTNIGQPL